MTQNIFISIKTYFVMSKWELLTVKQTKNWENGFDIAFEKKEVIFIQIFEIKKDFRPEAFYYASEKHTNCSHKDLFSFIKHTHFSHKDVFFHYSLVATSMTKFTQICYFMHYVGTYTKWEDFSLTITNCIQCLTEVKLMEWITNGKYLLF